MIGIAVFHVRHPHHPTAARQIAMPLPHDVIVSQTGPRLSTE
jgi:hypothetical protein